MKTKYFLILTSTLLLGSCDQLNSDNWQWEKPADWRLPLLSNYSTVILNYLPENKLNIIGNTIKDMPEEAAGIILTAGLLKLPNQFDTIFTSEVRNKISQFRAGTLKSSIEIGDLVNIMISEVEKQEKYPQVLEDFIDVIDEIVTKIGNNNGGIDKIIDDLNNTTIDRDIADVEANLGNLLGTENIESLASGTLLLDITKNTIPLSIDYTVEIKFSDGTAPKKETISIQKNETLSNKEINLSGAQIKNLESVSGSITGKVTGVNKDNLTQLMTGKLVTNVRVKLGTDKVLIKF